MSQNGSYNRLTYEQQLQLLQHQQQQLLLQQQQHLHRQQQQRRHHHHHHQQLQLPQLPQQLPRSSNTIIAGNGHVAAVVGAQNPPSTPAPRASNANNNVMGNGHVAVVVGAQNPVPPPLPAPDYPAAPVPPPAQSLIPGPTRLLLNPRRDHMPENYEGMELGFDPRVFSSLEQYMPPNMLHKPRDVKAQYMNDILMRYSPDGERLRIQKHKEYRQKILSSYQSLNKEIYTIDAEIFFVPSFLDAIRENTEAGFRCIMAEPCRGIYTFQMLRPEFCEMLASEVDHFERWVHEAKFSIMRPSTMNKFGVVLDDFGMDSMLATYMNDFISPLSRVFFAEFGGCTLDSHHGFVVEYGLHRDRELDSILYEICFLLVLLAYYAYTCSLLHKCISFAYFFATGFHVDDAEVTLNVCLGKQFSGGELFFRGVRCNAHVHTESQLEEIFDYAHVPGQAVLHSGRHRHGAKPTTSGKRMNLILWCRSSAFREMIKYQRDFAGWCGECKRKKKERERISIANTKQEFLKRTMIM